MTAKSVTGNAITLLENGNEFFPRLIDVIDEAQQEILIETFILEDDPVGRRVQRSLIAAAHRGAWVSVVVDGYGSHFLPQGFIDEMTRAGIHFLVYRPQPQWLRVRINLLRRMHRKLVVVDGRVAFIGGINLAYNHAPDYGPNFKQDYTAELTGPVVAQIRQFTQRAVGEYSNHNVRLARLPTNAVPSAPPGNAEVLFLTRDNKQSRTRIEEEYLKRIRAASHHVAIANPYFFPGYRLLKALRDAARRGVKVTLLIQGKLGSPLAQRASRTLYEFLVESEIELYEYWERQYHGKIAAFDDEWATIGSSNLDPLSLSLNLEANVFVKDRAFNSLIHDRIKALVEHSNVREINQSWFRRRTLIKWFSTFLIYHLFRHFPGLTGWMPPLEQETRASPRGAHPQRQNSDRGI